MNEYNGKMQRYDAYSLYGVVDTWRLNYLANRGIQVIVFICLSLTLQLHSGYADEINEFNQSADGWTMYPSTMGRGSESGWVNVTNDGEGSIRNNPTGTRYTYYWKLTRDIDLSHLETPALELKYHFKGHSYDYFRVQVGDEGAKKLSDFTVLHEVTTATAAPEDISIDLSEYEGQRIRVQFILRKPYDVVERRIGLYLHRAAITTPPQFDELDETPGELRVSAFNVQVFGLSKMDKPEVVTALLQIITRFDLVMIQEIRDISETAIQVLLNRLNTYSPTPYALFLSERSGRTSSKEQIAFLYREDKLRLVDGARIPDPMDLFERPPVWVEFEYIENQAALHILGAHLDPDHVPTEIEALYNDFVRYHVDATDDESVMVMGDFNAGCRYLNQDALASATLFQTDNLHSLITHDTDTTTTSTHCPYDRILVGGALMEHVLESGVYKYDQVLGLTGELTRSVSDHYPVWTRLDMSALGVDDGMGMTP